MKTLVKRTWMKKSACFGIIAVMMITLLSSIRVEAKNTNTGSSDLNVDYHTKAEIAQYLNSCSFDYAYKNNYDSVPSTSAP
ncbi:MAG: HK97 gp10 family phage protein, partial [Lachnospiraceae bacterium]|nr:HK97 gp10 family phage protein [Lachnospiraceae bacterium]